MRTRVLLATTTSNESFIVRFLDLIVWPYPLLFTVDTRHFDEIG